MTDDKPAGDGYDEKTQDELREILAERNLPVSGTKDEQIARLRESDNPPADAGDELTGGPSEDTEPIEGTPELGGSLGSIERSRAEAEADERAGIVEYEEATYKNDDAALLLSDIALELGLTRPEDYAELTRLNGIDLSSRVDAGQEIRLPKQYSYVDVEHVTGGSVRE
jgi:hypothetical protein